MKAMIALALATAACGQQPAATSADQATATATAQESTQPSASTAPDAGIHLLKAGQQLPDCTDASEGDTYYVVADDEFKACESGSWAVVDLKGKDGKDGAAGTAGAQGVAGAAGSDGKAGATGATGAAGIAGAAGAAGAQGAAGSAGSVALLDAANHKVGFVLDLIDSFNDTLMMFADGGVMRVDMNYGSYYGSISYLDSGAEGAVCAFTTTDCSGSCYLTGDWGVNGNSGVSMNYPMLNAVVWDGVNLWRYNGEPQANITTFASFWMANGATNACHHGNVNTNQQGSYGPLTVKETLPAGVTFPFGHLHMEPVQ
jgi:hypothetical protein